MHAADLIVGTAGHIDHGKTSLVRTLTGVHLDTLPEEQERGITIALGFTPLALPNGERAALVDVPGHEKLVRTMIAGATGLDAVILCVSAVDGAMPQTREHLAILDLLGVDQGVVALTMVDLVDEELLELAREDVSDLLATTRLAALPIIACSAIDGRGRDEILAHLATLSPRGRPETGPFRLPVDRTFTRQGFGTVVTGTSWSGTVENGSTVSLLPEGTEARIRGIEVHGEAASEAHAGRRVALNLSGIDRDQVSRGTVVVQGAVPTPLMVDVRYTHLESAEPLEDGSPVRVLLGTSERLGRLYFAADLEEIEPGHSTYAQLRLDGPLACLPGDPYVIRRTSPVDTLGGGVIVDPWAPRLRKKDRLKAGVALERLHGGDVEVWLERAGEEGLAPSAWKERHNGPAGELLGDRLYARRVVARLEGALLEALTDFHSTAPLSLGAHRRELRRGRLGHLSDKTFDALVARLEGLDAVSIEGPLIRIRGFEVQLTPAQEALMAALIATISEAAMAGISVKELHTTHPDPEVASLMRLIEARGDCVQIAGIGWMHADVLDTLCAKIRTWFTDQEGLTPGDFKDLTGLSRKTAIPLLEWLDGKRLTQRSGDRRIAGPAIAG